MRYKLLKERLKRPKCKMYDINFKKEMEETEFLKFSSINKEFSRRVTEKEQEFNTISSDYEINVLNSIESKCNNLNKITSKYICELDSNSKNIQISDFHIINKKKLCNKSFNQMMLNIEQIILDFEKVYNLFKSKVKLD